MGRLGFNPPCGTAAYYLSYANCKLTLCCTVTYKEQQQVNSFQIHELKIGQGIPDYVVLPCSRKVLFNAYVQHKRTRLAMKSFSCILTCFLYGFIISDETSSLAQGTWVVISPKGLVCLVSTVFN